MARPSNRAHEGGSSVANRETLPRDPARPQPVKWLEVGGEYGGDNAEQKSFGNTTRSGRDQRLPESVGTGSSLSSTLPSIALLVWIRVRQTGRRADSRGLPATDRPISRTKDARCGLRRKNSRLGGGTGKGY